LRDASVLQSPVMSQINGAQDLEQALRCCNGKNT
jgi:hypothetical protein